MIPPRVKTRGSRVSRVLQISQLWGRNAGGLRRQPDRETRRASRFDCASCGTSQRSQVSYTGRRNLVATLSTDMLRVTGSDGVLCFCGWGTGRIARSGWAREKEGYR